MLKRASAFTCLGLLLLLCWRSHGEESSDCLFMSDTTREINVFYTANKQFFTQDLPLTGEQTGTHSQIVLHLGSASLGPKFAFGVLSSLGHLAFSHGTNISIIQLLHLGVPPPPLSQVKSKHNKSHRGSRGGALHRIWDCWHDSYVQHH